MSCRGICSKFAHKPLTAEEHKLRQALIREGLAMPLPKLYAGLKYCSTCAEKMQVEQVNCPCCGYKLRVRRTEGPVNPKRMEAEAPAELEQPVEVPMITVRSL